VWIPLVASAEWGFLAPQISGVKILTPKGVGARRGDEEELGRLNMEVSLPSTRLPRQT